MLWRVSLYNTLVRFETILWPIVRGPSSGIFIGGKTGGGRGRAGGGGGGTWQSDMRVLARETIFTK